MVGGIGLVTGRMPSRRPEGHPWTQERTVTSGGEAQEVRYHVAIVAELHGNLQHLVLQYRRPAGERWASARRTVCGQSYDGLAGRASFTSGRWCQTCRDVARAEMSR